jgi:hypothetical protein
VRPLFPAVCAARQSDTGEALVWQLEMKPVCDHPSYCRNDANSIYIGQTYHLAYRPHRNNNNYIPTGFANIRDMWNNLCTYTRNANGNYALCNIPINSHSWRHPGQTDPGFMCARGERSAVHVHHELDSTRPCQLGTVKVASRAYRALPVLSDGACCSGSICCDAVARWIGHTCEPRARYPYITH